MGLFDRFGKKKGAGERAAEAAEMGGNCRGLYL